MTYTASASRQTRSLSAAVPGSTAKSFRLPSTHGSPVAMRRLLLLLSAALVLLLCAASGMAQAGFLPTPVAAFPGTTAVSHAASSALTVSVKFTAAGTPGTIEAVTAAQTGLDFALDTATVPGNACSTTGSYAVGDTCNVSVTFTPTYPGRRTGAVRLKTTSGALLAETLLRGDSTGSLPTLKPGQIDTVAGNGHPDYVTDDQPATQAQINLPNSVVVDGKGNLFLADLLNSRIRYVDTGGVIRAYAGTYSAAYTGDNGLAYYASLNQPAGLALDGAGNLYFADSGNNVVRRIDGVTRIITTVAGNGNPGFFGDGGAATSAMLSKPIGIALDGDGNLLIADSQNQRIRKVNAGTGIITTIAGSGQQSILGDGGPATTAALNNPKGVFVAANGTIYIADTGNARIRVINASGTINTIIGSDLAQYGGDGGAASAATLNNPQNVTLDPAGDIYITDAGSNRLRMINQATGNVETLVGTADNTFAGDLGPANKANLFAPSGVFFAPNGDLYVTDTYNNRVRKVSVQALTLTYPTMKVGKTSAPQVQGLLNEGNADLSLSAYVASQSGLDSSTTTCSFPVGTAAAPALSPAVGCNLGVVFKPTQVLSPDTGTLSLPSNASNTPVITLTGNVLSVNPSTTVVSVLAPSTNPSILGDAVTFQATVTSDATARIGSVGFTVDGNPVASCATVALTTAGTANCTVSGLTLGTHAVVATYTGDDDNSQSTSPTYSQVVKQHIDLALTGTPNPVAITKSVSFTLVVSTPSGTPAGTAVPTGSVSFLSDGTVIGTGTLAPSGSNSASASFSTSTLSLGTHSITATYAGDPNNAASSSASLSLVVRQGNTTTTVGSSNANVYAGAGVVLSSNVSSSDGLTPGGSVTFASGNTVLGTATVQPDGSATLASQVLATGTYSIVATYGGDINNAGSSSAALTQTVNKLPTTTTLSTDAATLSAGAPLHLTAQTVISPGYTAYGVPGGTVTFTDGGTTLGIATVAADGTATFTANGLTVGTHNLAATYSGDVNYAGSTGTHAQVVNQTASTINLTVAQSPVLAGRTATFVANVGSNTGVPSGTVTFQADGATIGSATLNGNGVASFSTTTLIVGTHSIVAIYNGDSNYTTVTSAPGTEVVNLASTTLALTGPSSVVVTTAANFTAALSSTGVTPSGTVTLYDGATIIGSQVLSTSGSVSFSTSSLSVGTHSITAHYGGDGNNAASTSAVVTVQVTQATTTTALVTSGTPSIVGNSVTFTATVTSGIGGLTGSVTLYDGATAIGTTTISNGVATFATSTLAFGDHSLTVVYSGDSNHSTSTSAVLAQRVIQASAVGITSSLNPALSGQAITFTATVPGVAGSVPTGTVAFTDGSTVLATVALNGSGIAVLQNSTLAVGTHTITATYSGDNNFHSSQASVSQVINLATTHVTVSVSANPATYAAATALTATVVSDGGPATGTVQFVDNNGAVVGSALLNSSGVAVLSTTALAPGAHSVVANYISDGKAASASSSAVTFVVKQLTSLALASNSNPAFSLDHVILTATLNSPKAVAATGSIVFLDGTATIGTATLNANGVATLDAGALTVGTHSITATYAGDNNDFPSTAAALSQVVELRSTKTALSFSNTNTADPQQVTLFVTVQSPNLSSVAGPTGTATIYNGTVVIGTVTLDANSAGALTIRLQTGQTESLTATYAGDSAYASSTSSATTVKAGDAAQFSLAVSNNALTVARGQHTGITVTATSVAGFSDTLKLGCVGLPYAATCTFTTDGTTVATTMALKSASSNTMQLMVDTGNPLGSGATATVSLLRTRNAVLCLLPACLLLCGKHRRRRLWPVLMLLLATLATAGVTGCGGLKTNSTPAGTYTFQVTAVGQGSGVTESQTVTITVGQ